MLNIQDRLDLYAGLLTLGVPKEFPDIAHTLGASLLSQPKTRMSPSNVIRKMGAGDVSSKRSHPTSTDAMKTSVGDGKKDSKTATSHYGRKVGHYPRDCRRKQKYKKEKKVEDEVAKKKEPELEDVDIGFSASNTMLELYTYTVL